MGIRVWDGQIELRYNNKYVDSCLKEERNYLLIHEMMHVLMHHCTWRQSSDDRLKYIDNVAMDLEINSMIHEDSFIKRPKFKEDVGIRKKGEDCGVFPYMFGFKDGLSYEQYRALLLAQFPPKSIQFIVDDGSGSGDGQGQGNGDQQDSNGQGNQQQQQGGGQGKNQGNGQGGTGGDEDSEGSDKQQQGGGSGSDGGQGGGQQSEQQQKGSAKRPKTRIDPNCPLGKITSGRVSTDHGKDYNEDTYADDWIRSEVERIQRNNLWGNTPGGTVAKILKAQEQPLDWAGLLRLEAGRFISFEKVYTRRRWDKHFGKPFLGYTMKSVEPVAVYADTSASVGNSDLSRFVVEIERIAHYTQVMLYCFDTNIKNPEEPILFSREAIDGIEFKGRGGTSFTPIFEHAKAHEIHQVVMLTDGFAEAISEEEIGDCSVIWVITKGGNQQGKPGVVVEMQ
jgi:predicted metal-dependent peptidase